MVTGRRTLTTFAGLFRAPSHRAGARGTEVLDEVVPLRDRRTTAVYPDAIRLGFHAGDAFFGRLVIPVLSLSSSLSHRALRPGRLRRSGLVHGGRTAPAYRVAPERPGDRFILIEVDYQVN